VIVCVDTTVAPGSVVDSMIVEVSRSTDVLVTIAPGRVL